MDKDEPVKLPDIDDLRVLDGAGFQRVEQFSSARRIGATLVGIYVAVGILFLVWSLKDGEPQPAERFLDSMVKLGIIVSGGGWGTIGIAISLIAVAITAATIVGLRDPDEESWRRRYLIMSMADTFTVASIGLLAGCAISTLIGYLGLAIQVKDDSVTERSVGLLSIMGVSVLLWFCVGSAYSHLREISLSDRDAMLKEKRSIDERLSGYRQSMVKLEAELRKIKKMDLPNDTVGRTALKAVLASVVVVIILALVTASLVFFPVPPIADLAGVWPRFWSVSFRTALLALISMVFTMYPLSWIFRIWKTGKRDIRGVLKVLGALLITSPLWALVPLTIILSIFSPEVNSPVWKRIILSISVLLPGIIMLVVKRRWAWRTVSALRSYRKLQGMRYPLERRSLALANEHKLAVALKRTRSNEPDNPLALQTSIDDKLTDVIEALKGIALLLESQTTSIKKSVKPLPSSKKRQVLRHLLNILRT